MIIHGIIFYSLGGFGWFQEYTSSAEVFIFFSLGGFGRFQECTSSAEVLCGISISLHTEKLIKWLIMSLVRFVKL